MEKKNSSVCAHYSTATPTHRAQLCEDASAADSTCILTRASCLLIPPFCSRMRVCVCVWGSCQKKKKLSPGMGKRCTAHIHTRVCKVTHTRSMYLCVCVCVLSLSTNPLCPHTHARTHTHTHLARSYKLRYKRACAAVVVHARLSIAVFSLRPRVSLGGCALSFSRVPTPHHPFCTSFLYPLGFSTPHPYSLVLLLDWQLFLPLLSSLPNHQQQTLCHPSLKIRTKKEEVQGVASAAARKGKGSTSKSRALQTCFHA